MVPVLEAVPNISEGRDPDWVGGLVQDIAATGADVLDWSSDPDHNRSVITFLGDPATVERAALICARRSMEDLDLRSHHGVHPRVGALDVLPFVPLHGLTMDDAVLSAHRVGEALGDLGLPVYYYGAAARTPRSLAALRRGGFEAFAAGYPPGRVPDVLPRGREGPHPSAGVVCVGARPVLLAWNIEVEGVPLEGLRGLAGEVREKGGGFPSLRALAFELEGSRRHQISMNLEDVDGTSPFAVFRYIEKRVEALGGRVIGTEVIGMIPDGLLVAAGEDRLHLHGSSASRLLAIRLAEHVHGRLARGVGDLLDAIGAEGTQVPSAVHDAAARLAVDFGATANPGRGP